MIGGRGSRVCKHRARGGGDCDGGEGTDGWGRAVQNREGLTDAQGRPRGGAGARMEGGTGEAEGERGCAAQSGGINRAGPRGSETEAGCRCERDGPAGSKGRGGGVSGLFSDFIFL